MLECRYAKRGSMEDINDNTKNGKALFKDSDEGGKDDAGLIDKEKERSDNMLRYLSYLTTLAA